MALVDLQVFVQERLRLFLGENTDVSPGSPADAQVIQPILRRLGSDPFSVDMGVFLQDRLNQEFPSLPTKEGDAITDLLIKPAIVLFDPIVRENMRVRQNLSLRDPDLLTTEEAEALGANIFSERKQGDRSRGVARIYFAQARQASVSPVNFVSSQGGLNFFPTEVQSISLQEMLFNLEGDLYYFDVNVVAENAGDQYNIGLDELVAVSNLGAAVRVTNKNRFRFGEPEETAADFVSRLEQDLTERSLVTERGVVAKITKNFSEVTRIAVTGFNDPEMHRDVIRGGGLGQLLAGGLLLSAGIDGENRVLTRRISIDASEGVDFTALLGAIGSVSGTGFTVTIHGGFPVGSIPIVRDIAVRAVINALTLDLEEQVLDYTAANKPWTLRKNELTLSGIPGGILFPDAADGTVAIPNDTIHVGGATDTYVRGTDFDVASFVISDIVDDAPILQGLELNVFNSTGSVDLADLVLGVDYSVDDGTYQALQTAALESLSLQIRDTPIAASYRILSVTQTPGLSPRLVLSPAPTLVAGDFRWRLLDTINIDLGEPKETKISGSDMRSIQGANYFDTASLVDFDSYGVAPGDIVLVTGNSIVAGTYTVQQVLFPFFSRIEVDRPVPATVTGLSYVVYRPNREGGVSLPLVRITSIDLLDTSNQPIGSKIPLASPVDVRTKGFANVGRGVKVDVTDAVLGIVTKPVTGTVGNVTGLSLDLRWTGTTGLTVLVSVGFLGANPLSAASIVAQINAACSSATGGVYPRVAVVVGGDRVGILPVGSNTSVYGGTARLSLFGYVDTYNAWDVRSDIVRANGGWGSLRPALDVNFDVIQVLDGLQIGFYDTEAYDAVLSPTENDVIQTGGQDTGVVDETQFSPEINRHIQVGARSLGTARAYFLEPTSFQVDVNTFFTLTRTDGALLRFLPDPTNTYQVVPSLPSGVKPTDGSSTAAGTTFDSLSVDFQQRGVRAGDSLVLDYIPLVGGGAPLADPVPGLSTLNLVVSIDGGINKTITFIHDDNGIPATDVTRAGVITQINNTIGKTIAFLSASNHLEFNPDASLIVRPTGTANTALGFSTSVDSSNDNPNKGTYFIGAVAPSGLTTRLVVYNTTFVSTETRQQYKIFRPGLQRICSTDMAKNVGEAGLYYFDVQLISQGTGDQYNVGTDLPLVATGYKSDGYYLTTEDSNLTFSPVERPHLLLSRSILEVGTTDDPTNATLISGQNIQINYERSTLTGSVQNFCLSETERVINQSPLARHLIPYFVRFDLTYIGGSKESEVRPDIERYIKNLFPRDSLEVSELEKIVSARGARSIDNPISLIAIVHNVDRSITAEKSQDRLNTGRLAAFIPDVLSISRRLS